MLAVKNVQIVVEDKALRITVLKLHLVKCHILFEMNVIHCRHSLTLKGIKPLTSVNDKIFLSALSPISKQPVNGSKIAHKATKSGEGLNSLSLLAFVISPHILGVRKTISRYRTGVAGKIHADEI